jgi:hypothetical protein
VTSTVWVIAGIALGVAVIVLGLFMLLSKRQTGEAEVELFGNKARGPVGLVVFCIGATLFVIFVRQISTPLFTNGSSPPTIPVVPATPGSDDVSAAPTPDGAHVDFIFPEEGSEINAGQDVILSGSVTGLGDDDLWIISRHEVGGSFYLIPPAITKDGPWDVLDQRVGDPSDKGSYFVYYAVRANADCTKSLSSVRNSFRDLPQGCTVVQGQLSVRIK